MNTLRLTLKYFIKIPINNHRHTRPHSYFSSQIQYLFIYSLRYNA